MPQPPPSSPERDTERASTARETRRGLRTQAASRPHALLSLMGASDLDAEAVIKAIEVEPALCGRVVAVCHSVAGGGARGITTVRRAVLHLGPKRVKALGMAFGVQLMAEALTLPQDFMNRFWQTTLWKAEAARLLAEHTQPDLTDDAFMIGLLQDIGLPALLSTRPDAFDEFATVDNADWVARERELFGMDHARAGGELLHTWGVPDAICQAVATHHAADPQKIRIDAALRVPCAAAALIPHHPDRPLSDAGCARWQALHAAHLADAFPTALDALDAIAHRALNRAESSEPGHGGDIATILAPMLARVAENTAQLVGESIPGLPEVVRVHAADEDGDADAAAEPGTAAAYLRTPAAATAGGDSLEALRYEAFTDDLTKLLSRRGFQRLAEERLTQVRADAERARRSGRTAPAAPLAHPADPTEKRCDPRDGVLRPGTGAVCVMLIDLNNFKPINDTFGHGAGDRALRAIADGLRRCVRSSDLLGRLGGDEFVILLDHIPEPAARRHAARLHGACDGLPVRVTANDTVHLGFSLGVAWAPDLHGDTTLQSLIEAADAGMYAAKRSDGRVSFTALPGARPAAA